MGNKQAMLLPVLLLGGVIGYGASEYAPVKSAVLSVASITKNEISASCNIKGNISMNTGERIYHVPGQMYYDETRISLGKGERWFCSEAEAISAGWRKSHV